MKSTTMNLLYAMICVHVSQRPICIAPVYCVLSDIGRKNKLWSMTIRIVQSESSEFHIIM